MPDNVGAFLVPPALRPGAVVRIIAPSGPFDVELFERGVQWLGERYEVQIAEGCLARNGFLAGPDELRRSSLEAALAAPVDAIIAARGGYGATRIAHRVDWTQLQRSPKWLVGFSDVTALHLEALAVGVCSLHAENVAGLGRASAVAQDEWRLALEEPTRAHSLSGLSGWHSGAAEGPLCGGNLTVLFAVHAAGRLRLPRGAVLALEDITEAPYRVDRMLTALIIAGAFDGVAGVVLGDFTDCAAGTHGVPVEAVLQERLAELRVPILAGLEFGHGARNRPLPFGQRARVDANQGRLELGLLP